MSEERILILDFGSQYSPLIARRVREVGVYCELHSCDMSAQEIIDFAPRGIILSGGPETVTAAHTPRAPHIVFELGCPVLGICYGMQTMAEQLQGEVEACEHREFGYAEVAVQGHSLLLDGIQDKQAPDGAALLDMWMSHGDQVKSLPPGFNVIASTKNTPIAAMADESRHFYGVLFHVEVTHSPQGARILERFVRNICRCDANWDAAHIVEESLSNIRQKVGSSRVILGLSGGVDSSVAAALLHKAIGQQLVCIFVDTGLLRHKENEQLIEIFSNFVGLHIVHVDAKARFLEALVGVSDAEQKRKIIGKLFVDVFEEEARKLDDVQWLAQGTIYSDVIESARTHAGKAHVIKSHHNVGGLPETMKLQLIEPLRDLFKDEVRKLGLELGLPHEMMYRHPFPGPGLAVRILGEIKAEYLEILRKADAIFIEELHRADYYRNISQAFAVFLPIKSVAVMGDARQYAYVLALRAVETVDFMTARWAYLPHEFLDKVSHRLINEVPHVSRVVYDISGKPPATVEWE